jgi:DGQHR domain-containing protein
MSTRIATGSDLNLTDPLDVTIGSFHIGEYRVPFLTSILRAQQAEEYLDLVTDDPKYAEQDWTVEELFQREISYGRVIDIADNYLDPKRAKRPPFFNSLTIVLVPKEIKKGQSYNPPTKNENYEHFNTTGPIGITYNKKDKDNDYPAANSFGTVQWNREEVYGVAIDGQHRLAAIKHLFKNNRNAARNLYISLIFIIVDPEVGFLIPDGEKFNPTKYMRSIFIDLNKHSVPVSRARNLLLDDLDPMALFVRGLISPSLSYEKTEKVNDQDIPIGTNDEFDNCLPLDIVDWHSESKSKVDEGPYITSILGLDWIVNTTLNKCKYPYLRPIDISKLDPDNEKYWDILENTFKTWKLSWREGIKEHLKDCKKQERPFILKREELRNLQKEFKKHWGKPITRLLTTTGCYTELVRKRIDKELISPKFGQWYQLKAAYQTAKPGKEKGYYKQRLDSVEETLKEGGISIKIYQEAVEDIDKSLKKNRILYYLVAQRAVVYSLIELLNSNKIVSWSQETDVGLEKFSECVNDFCAYYLVEALNKLHSVFAPGSDGIFEKNCKVTDKNIQEDAQELRKEYWAGSLTRRDNPLEMDFSDAAARRGAKWFTLISHLYWFLKCNSKNKKITKQIIVDSVEDPDPSEGLPMGDELSYALGSIAAIAKYNDSPMKFLAGAVLDNPDDEIEIVNAAAKERVEYLCDLFTEAGMFEKDD